MGHIGLKNPALTLRCFTGIGAREAFEQKGLREFDGLLASTLPHEKIKDKNKNKENEAPKSPDCMNSMRRRSKRRALSVSKTNIKISQDETSSSVDTLVEKSSLDTHEEFTNNSKEQISTQDIRYALRNRGLNTIREANGIGQFPQNADEQKSVNSPKTSTIFGKKSKGRKIKAGASNTTVVISTRAAKAAIKEQQKKGPGIKITPSLLTFF